MAAMKYKLLSEFYCCFRNLILPKHLTYEKSQSFVQLLKSRYAFIKKFGKLFLNLYTSACQRRELIEKRLQFLLSRTGPEVKI